MTMRQKRGTEKKPVHIRAHNRMTLSKKHLDSLNCAFARIAAQVDSLRQRKRWKGDGEMLLTALKNAPE